MTDETMPAVGTVVLAGGLIFLGVGVALYFFGLGAAAVLPVAFVAGCCMVGGLVALVWRA